MSTLYITEYSALGTNERGGLNQVAMAPSIADQTVAVGGASASSAAFDPRTNLVRVQSDVVCSIKFGTSPTATTSTMRLAANAAEYIGVPVGKNFMVAVIANT